MANQNQGGEIVQFTLNYEGVDYNITAELETATTLLNDPDLAREYIENLLENRNGALAHQDDNFDYNNQVFDDSQDLEYDTHHEVENSESATELSTAVWDSAKTEKFLKIRLKYNSQFNDKKTHKNVLWAKIAEELNGIVIPKEGERCRQKFVNLQKRYKEFLRNATTTGAAAKPTPKHYELLQAIIGDKDKFQPKNLQSSEDQASDEPSTSSSSSVSAIKNRFAKVKKTEKPASTGEKILEFMKKEREESQSQKKEEFLFFQQQLTTQSEQRERMLGFMEKLLDRRGQKRPASFSSDSD